MAVAESPCLSPGFLRRPSPPVYLPIGEEESHRAEQQPQGRRVEATHLVGLVHKLESDGGDQNPGPERHDGRDQAPGSPDVDADERPQNQRRPANETPEPRGQRPHDVPL